MIINFKSVIKSVISMKILKITYIVFYQIRNLDQALMLTSVNKCDTIDSIETLNLNNIQKIKSKYQASKNKRPFSKIKDLGRR